MKYRVYGIASASWHIGDFEADSLEDAEEMAFESENSNTPTLCNHCADVFEIDEILRVDMIPMKDQ